MRAEKLPACQGDGIVKGEGFRREIPGEGRAIVEQERDTMIGVAGRVQDFSGNSQPGEERAALRKRNGDVAMLGNVDIIVPRLGPGLHDGDGANLHVEDEQGHAFPLHLLCKPGMVDVIVGGERVANLAQGDAHLLEAGLHGPEGARPTDIHQQAGSTLAHHPVVG